MARPAEGASAEAVPGEGGTVEFGWEDDRKLSSRRKKLNKHQKAKPGSFGTFVAASICVHTPHLEVTAVPLVLRFLIWF